MKQSSKPSFDTAITAVRTDIDARFAATLAAVFAFSAGFALGVVIGASQAESASSDLAEDADGPSS